MLAEAPLILEVLAPLSGSSTLSVAVDGLTEFLPVASLEAAAMPTLEALP